MSCKNIQTRLDLYAGGDLEAREAGEVAAHLRTCLACYREYVELHDLLMSVRGTSRDHARGDAETESLVAGVMREIHGPPPPVPQLLPRLAMVSGWAAALLVTGSLGWQVLASRTTPSPGGTPPRVIDRGGSDALSFEQIKPASPLEEDLARQLEELRHRNPSRGAPVHEASSVRTRNF
jgi:hypothetical protein